MEDGTKAPGDRSDAVGRRRGAAAARRGDGHGPPRRPARRRRPGPKGAPRAGVARALGLAATVVLLGVGVAVLPMVTGRGHKPSRQTRAATPTAAATAAARARRLRRPQLTN